MAPFNSAKSEARTNAHAKGDNSAPARSVIAALVNLVGSPDISCISPRICLSASDKELSLVSISERFSVIFSCFSSTDDGTTIR